MRLGSAASIWELAGCQVGLPWAKGLKMSPEPAGWPGLVQAAALLSRRCQETVLVPKHSQVCLWPVCGCFPQ